jgi:hypothetical protein
MKTVVPSTCAACPGRRRRSRVRPGDVMAGEAIKRSLPVQVALAAAPNQNDRALVLRGIPLS